MHRWRSFCSRFCNRKRVFGRKTKTTEFNWNDIRHTHTQTLQLLDAGSTRVWDRERACARASYSQWCACCHCFYQELQGLEIETRFPIESFFLAWIRWTLARRFITHRLLCAIISRRHGPCWRMSTEKESETERGGAINYVVRSGLIYETNELEQDLFSHQRLCSPDVVGAMLL